MTTSSFLKQAPVLAAVSFIITYLVTIAVVRLAHYIGLVDQPQRDHPGIIHTRPVARGGGIPLLAGLLVTSFLFLPMNPSLIAILIGSFLNVLVGTIDDRFNLSPYIRLLFTLPLAALPIILVGTHISISNPFGPGIFTFDWIHYQIPPFNIQVSLPEALLLMFWIVWVCNMMNWTKGASQLPGMAVIAFLTLGGVALKYQAGNPHQIVTAQLSIILAAASLALLPFNYPPERIFPGFGGSTFIGFNLAVLSVLSGGKLAAALLVLGIPVADMCISIWRRINQGGSPLIGDRGHLYHLLLDLKLSKKQVIWIYWLVTLCLGIFALSLERGQKLFAIVLVSILTFGIFLIIRSWLAKNTKARGQLKTLRKHSQ
ncbi:undecaprenyl/decaprenyl-phosphate alpha-N-acetylglucosaminyl 1-phosphate transferase [Patescibacteria group bacterium]|nr:undecaprenyl/decaprenyl-phosphate alpha-N-acetylglucosaminyl 1-phosphate transferase [Patescibacteria group bacterium]